MWKCNIVARQLWVSFSSVIIGDGATFCVCYILGVERWKKSCSLAVYGEWKLRKCCSVAVAVTCWSVTMGGQVRVLVRVGFMVNKVHCDSFFCDIISFAVNIIAPMICTHISFICIWYIMVAVDRIIKENISVCVFFFQQE